MEYIIRIPYYVFHIVDPLTRPLGITATIFSLEPPSWELLLGGSKFELSIASSNIAVQRAVVRKILITAGVSCNEPNENYRINQSDMR